MSIDFLVFKKRSLLRETKNTSSWRVTAQNGAKLGRFDLQHRGVAAELGGDRVPVLLVRVRGGLDEDQPARIRRFHGTPRLDVHENLLNGQEAIDERLVG